MKSRTLSFLIFFSVAIGAARGAEHPLLTEKLIQLQQKYNLIGFSVTATLDGEVAYSGAFGARDVSRGLAVTPLTKYRFASVTKLLTATALMRLAERGLVDIHADVSNYLGWALRNPNFPAVPISLEQLMTHTSSLRDGSGYADFLSDSYRTDTPPPIQSILLPGGDYFTDDAWSSTNPPGDAAGFSYCNLGSGVLATVVEKVSGKRFHLFCRDEIFTPLGINACLQDLENLADFNQLAVIYRYDSHGAPVPQADNYRGVVPLPVHWDAIPLGWNGIVHAPQGGLRVSTDDLARLMQAHMQGGMWGGYALLRPETVANMHAQHWKGYGMDGFYRKKGLQVHITDDLVAGRTFKGHAGEAYGLLSDLYFSADYRFGAVFATNGGNYGEGQRVFYDVEEDVFGLLYEWLVLAGDVNRDHRVSAADYLVLADWLGENRKYIPAGLEKADLDENGKVDAVDLVLLARKLSSEQTGKWTAGPIRQNRQKPN